jgi:hypothetical protein
MRHEAWTAGRAVVLRHQSLLVGSVVVLLLAGALSVVVGTALGLASFTDVGYPDSATLLRIGEVMRSGSIYPAIDRPPYLVSLYGPLTYVLLGIPYSLAQATGITPQVLVRLGIVGAVCLCVLIIFLISRRLYGSRPIAWLCALFAVSALPMASWTTQIRGDFLGLGLSLLSVYLFLLTNGRPQAIGAAICAGLAPLVKQTFFAAPIAIIIWLIYKRRYKEAVFWAAGFALTVVGGYAIMWWREPLMLEHIAALRHPPLEYREALHITSVAVSQPVVVFAAIGGLFALWKRTPETVLFLIYCVVAWVVATVTIPQAVGNINYFWEPLLASAVLAGPGLCEFQRKANRTPILVTAMLFVLLLRSFLPMLWDDLNCLRQSYREASDYQERKARWESFVSIVSGRRLLSTFPDITVLSRTPEIPDPGLNSVLELRGFWDPVPVAAEIDAEVYDLIVIPKGMADKVPDYRGLRPWSDGMWSAMKGTYRLACLFEDKEIWLPRRDSGEILRRLLAIGCQAPATEGSRVGPSPTSGPTAAFPLKISGNKRYVTDQNNAPFLILGDSPQSLVANVSLADTASYFSTRQSQGFNCAWIQLLCIDYTGGRKDGRTYDGLAPFTTAWDFSTPNPAYWSRVDAIVNLAATYGICCFLDLADTGGLIDTITANGPSKCFNYGVFLGNRYKSFPNIVWLNGNDYDQRGKGKASDASVQAIALGVKSVDTNHFQTVEVSPYPYPAGIAGDYRTVGGTTLESVTTWNDSPWSAIISMNMVYSWVTQYDALLRAYNDAPTMPTFLGEAEYEGESVVYMGSPRELRLQEWWAATCGTAGQFYGSPTWYFPRNWRSKWLKTPGITQLGYLRSFLNAIPWHNLVPEQTHSVLAAGLGTYTTTGDPAKSDYATCAWVPDGSLAVVFMPTKRTVTVAMSKFSGPVTAQWYDPTSGKFAKIAGSPFVNTGDGQFTPAGKNAGGDSDWVLLLTTLNPSNAADKEREKAEPSRLLRSGGES